MKITVVQGAFLPVPPLLGGAVEKVWCALGAEFARRGHNVTHISRRHRELPISQVLNGVSHLRIPGFDAPRSLLQLKLLDLLYSLRATRALPAADILVTNTFWLPMLIRSSRFGRLYVHVQRFPKGQMQFYGHASRIQTVSTHIGQAICKQAPKLKGKVKVIPNPLPPSAFDTSLRPPNREKVLLFVGRVHPEKGIGLLIQACAESAVFAHEEWRVRIVGPHEVRFGGGGERYFEDLRKLARRLGERVEWCGPVFDAGKLNEEYDRASLFVYPSLAETGEALPLAPLEAMARSCPPLVTDIRCFNDYIKDSINGFSFKHAVGNPTAVLAAKLNEVLSNSDLLNQAGRAARESAREFCLESVANKYLEDFSSLLA